MVIAAAFYVSPGFLLSLLVAPSVLKESDTLVVLASDLRDMVDWQLQIKNNCNG